MAADIISDIFAAWSLFSRSNYCISINSTTWPLCHNFQKNKQGSLFESNYFTWGVYTLIPILLPLIARIVLNLVALTRCFEKDQDNSGIKINSARRNLWIEDLKQLPWHITLLQPFRYNQAYIFVLNKKIHFSSKLFHNTLHRKNQKTFTCYCYWEFQFEIENNRTQHLWSCWIVSDS